MGERKMILLENNGWQADILPEHGMNTIRLCRNGEHILRDPAGAEGVETSCLHGSPLLLPPNRTEDGIFTFDGKTYVLPVNETDRNNHLHGFLRCQAFTVTEQSQSHVTAHYENKGDIFPFPFAIRVTCRLEEDGYRQSYTVQNTGSTAMPLTFALHTNFEEKDHFCVPIEKCFPVNDRFIPQGAPVALDARQRQYRDGMRPDGGNVDGFYTSGGNTARIGGVAYTVSENFNQWILFNKYGGHGFLCIEPQCGAVNCLNNGYGLGRLEPGQSETFQTWIHPAR